MDVNGLLINCFSMSNMMVSRIPHEITQLFEKILVTWVDVIFVPCITRVSSQYLSAMFSRKVVASRNPWERFENINFYEL